MITYQCYHGTGEANSNEILSNRVFEFKYRSNHWLGQGVYFFINDFEKAKWWAESNRPDEHTSPVVLKCKVKLQKYELLDLNTETDLKKLDDFTYTFFKSLKKENITLKLNDIHEKNCKIIDMFLHINSEYKAIHRTFISTNTRPNRAGFQMISDQLCITDQSIIPFEEIELFSVGT